MDQKHEKESEKTNQRVRTDIMLLIPSKEVISRTYNYYQDRQPSRKMDKILDEALPEGAPLISQ